MLNYIKGMDISSLDEIEKLGAKFYDNGKEGDLIEILKNYDTNYIRLRLWNDPKSPDGKPYGAGNTDFETTLRMAKRVKAAGLGFLLDFHYSDFWADPGKQRKPKAWADYNADQLEQAVYDFTKEMMTNFIKEGAAPDMVQVGNELSNGFLWPEGQAPNYANIARFVSAGIRAVKETCPAAKIMIHLDNGGNNALYREWFEQYINVNKGEDFDIIGLSYYPFWHGTLDDLSNNMNDIAVRFGKELVIAEVSMGHTTEDYIEYEKLAPENRKGMATSTVDCDKVVPFSMSKEGQCAFMKALFETLEKVPQNKARGFFYWEAGWLPVEGSGWASEEALAYIKEKGPGGNEWANQALFDYDGNALPALEVIRDYRPDRAMITGNIAELVSYGIATGLIGEADRIYTTNRLLELFGLDEYEEPQTQTVITNPASFDLEGLLGQMLDYAVENGLLPDDSIVYRDLFDTKIMGILVPRPSDVIYTFQKLCDEQGARAATDWYYTFSQNTDYIRRYRIARDMKWKADTAYGEMDITINLSKPEKDPKAIAAAKNAKQSGYPKCQLCMENEGYAGRVNHPARQNHRIIPIKIQGNKWGFQYSPYVYYNEHCIVFNSQHIPMKIEHDTFEKLFSFVEQFPHYFVGSNADLPIVGGSILSHDHFQGGNYEFAMAKAPIEKAFQIKGFEDIDTGIVKWPMSVIRLSHKDYNRIIELADVILAKWRSYTDESVFIFAQTDGEPHNTITPIARKRGDNYELDLVLRNNITTEEHPLGVYHPHAELHHIKKENIGLIEVMGLAVLPSRLKSELEQLADAILAKEDIRKNEVLEKHADWVDEFLPKYDNVSKDNVMDIIQKEVGIVFGKVLEHAGVYKQDEAGRAAFQKFIDCIE